MVNKIKLTPLTSVGQIKRGDKLLLSDGKKVTIETAKDLYTPRVGDVEVIVIRKANKFFSTEVYLDGQSWVKECFVVTVEDDEK